MTIVICFALRGESRGRRLSLVFQYWATLETAMYKNTKREFIVYISPFADITRITHTLIIDCFTDKNRE